MYERSLNKQDKRILSIAWHVEEKLIVTGSIDNIRIWNANTGHTMQRLSLDRANVTMETIVWNVAILKDYTIISTDSIGKVRFWDGHHGTLIKSFFTHKADILALSVSKEEDKVYAAGIDPKIVQFQYVPVGSQGKQQWVQSRMLEDLHTHDVRALACTEQNIISG
ncbi:U3 small nucleolar RNA-associated protein 4 homolog, partial [Saccoglossus kowalevskii]